MITKILLCSSVFLLPLTGLGQTWHTAIGSGDGAWYDVDSDTQHVVYSVATEAVSHSPVYMCNDISQLIESIP